MINVSGLYIYPIKSCRGIRLERADVAERGLAYDRRWMLVDAEDAFITQRKHPRLAQICVALDGATMRINGPGMPHFVAPLAVERGERRQVHVWGDRCWAFVHANLSDWFTQFLDVRCRAVFMPDDVHRQVDPARSRPGDIVSFADGFPFLLISEASLDDLNQRLDTPITMERFRPNIVVTGSAPFAEDNWARMRIGSILFRGVKPCSRCNVTTVDPHSGELGVEPLRTLASYRKCEGKVYFGMNLVHAGRGTLHVGDPVTLLGV